MTKTGEVYKCNICGMVIEVANEGGGELVCCNQPMELQKEITGNKINFNQFEKIDLRIGKIIEAERVDGSDKLVKLQVDLGDEKRQILAGIGKSYSPEELLNKSVAVVINLEPKIIIGLESRGMVLAAKDNNNLSVLVPEKEIVPGSKIS
ncbi:MAG: methionine--tRNA ligase subunit beta [Candidatus Paceibacterota bacterium]|jgi:methionine--tRNA ligase beta chain